MTYTKRKPSRADAIRAELAKLKRKADAAMIAELAAQHGVCAEYVAQIVRQWEKKQ